MFCVEPPASEMVGGVERQGAECLESGLRNFKNLGARRAACDDPPWSRSRRATR